MSIESKKYDDYGTFSFSPKPGRHYILGQGNTPQTNYELDAPGSREPVAGMILLCPFIRNLITFPLTWHEIIPEQEAKKKGLNPLATYSVNASKDGEGADAAPVQKLSFVKRSNDQQYFLFTQERHPFIIDVVTIEGGDIRIIFYVTTKIQNAMAIIRNFPDGDFLIQTEEKLDDLLSRKLRQLDFEQISEIKTLEENEKLSDHIRKKIIPKATEWVANRGFEIQDVFVEEILPLSKMQRIIDQKANNKIAELAKQEAASASDAMKTRAEGKAAEARLLNKAELDKNAEANQQAIDKAKELTAIETVNRQKILETENTLKKDYAKFDTEQAKERIVAVTASIKEIKATIDVTKTTVAENLAKNQGTLVILGNDGNGSDGAQKLSMLESQLIANFMTNEKKGSETKDKP